MASVKHLSLVNLITEKEIVTELLQNKMTPKNIVKERLNKIKTLLIYVAVVLIVCKSKYIPKQGFQRYALSFYEYHKFWDTIHL